MSSLARTSFRILAIDPSYRGFGFAILEGGSLLIDWGIKSARQGKDAQMLVKIKELIVLYRPQAVVLEAEAGKGSRRCQRLQALFEMVEALVLGQRMSVCRFSAKQVRNLFARFGAASKDDRARVIVQTFPELVPRLPPVRRPWMSEDYRMGIFDAVSLGLTFFFTRRQRFTNDN